MTKKKPKLNKPGPDGYAPDTCAACGGISEMVDATNFLDLDNNIPLCCPCWAVLSDEYHAANPRPKADPAPDPEIDEPEEEFEPCADTEPFRLFG